MTLDIGDEAPPFELRNQHRELVDLDDLIGRKSVVVFIPFAFTKTCENELREIRDNFHVFDRADARVIVITCDTTASNARWAADNGFEFDILSDFWPHGEVARRYDTFDETFGYARRTTYFLDEFATIIEVVSSDELRVARPFPAYEKALAFD